MKRFGIWATAALALVLLGAPPSARAGDEYFSMASTTVPATSACSGPTYAVTVDFPYESCLTQATVGDRFYVIGAWYPSGISNHTGNWGWELKFISTAGATNAATCWEVRGFVERNAADVASALSLDPCTAGRLGSTVSVLTDGTTGLSATQLYSAGDVGSAIKNEAGAACDAGCLNKPIRLCVVRAPTTSCTNNNTNTARAYGLHISTP